MKIFFGLLVIISAAAAVSYDGYKVVRVWPTGEQSRQYLKKVTRGGIGVELLTEIGHIGRPVDVSVSPKAYKLFHDKLHRMDVHHHTKIEDLQMLIDENRQGNDMAKRVKIATKGFVNSYYRTLEEINDQVDMWISDYPKLFSKYNNGDLTYEGRAVSVTKVSTDASSTSKPAVWLDCGIHAREWISSATCLYVLSELTTYGTLGADEVTQLLDTYDFHVVVNVNPDGYEYTWTTDRMWRKNRVPYGTTTGPIGGEKPCTGADPNRNFDSNFGGVGASDNCGNDAYHGAYAFSEAESRSVRDALTSLGTRTKIAFTLHAYSQYWMTPYGYQYTHPEDYDVMISVAKTGAAALATVNGTVFQVGAIADVIYEASGGSTDWFYDALKITYPYALELRDQGKYGFVLPASLIDVTSRETWTGIKASIKAI